MNTNLDWKTACEAAVLELDNSKNTNLNWQTAYEAAVLEMDNSKLNEKAHVASNAIFARLRALPLGEYKERLAMQGAMTALGNLLSERLGG
jgi:hypothetical protein